MIAASSLAFPGSKTLAAWWRQLAAFQPSALWVGHLFVHRLEALAQVVRAEQVEPLPLMLLRAVSLEPVAAAEPSAHSPAPLDAAWLKRLDERLHLSLAVTARLLRDLQAEGFLSGTAMPALTERGRLVVAHGHYPRQVWQRREFAFAERLAPDGQRQLPPHFLPLLLDSAPGWQPDDKSGIDLAGLRQCSAQANAWKEQFVFPADVLKIADAADPGDDPPPWQRIVVDRPERLLLAVIAVGTDVLEPRQLLGFGARQEGWELRSDKPILTLPWSARQEFPDLATWPDIVAWTRTWQAWCLGRQIPQAETAECALEQSGCRLSIQVPPALYRRLETSRSDLLKGDSWFLAGSGCVRSAVQVHLSAIPAS